MPSKSFLSLFFCLFLRISYAELVLTGLRYKGTTVNQTFLVRKFDHFFLTSEAFRVLSFFPARELVLILLLAYILPY